MGQTQIIEKGVELNVNRTPVNASGSGLTECVAAQGAGVKMRVVALVLVAGAAVTVTFKSASTDISAGFPIGTNGGMALPYNPKGWFQTASNEALNVNLSGAVATGIQIVWARAT